MKDKLEQILLKLRETRLDESVRSDIRKRLIDYIEAHPVRLVPSPRLSKVEAMRVSPWFVRSSHLRILYRYGAAVTIVTLILGSSVSLAAESALPGDPLYAVKTGVNENLGSLVALSSESKAKWETTLTTRRLEEAEKLAVTNRLDEDTQAQLQNHIKTHTANSVAQINNLVANQQVTVAAEVTSKLEANLKAHEHVLSQIALTDANITPVVAEVSAQVAVVADHRAALEQEIIGTTTPTVKEAVKEAVETKLNDAQDQVDEAASFVKNTPSDEATTQVATVQVEAAALNLKEAQADIEASDYGKAFVHLQKAAEHQEASKVLLETTADLNLSTDTVTKNKPETSPATTTASTTTMKNDTASSSSLQVEADAKATSTATTSIPKLIKDFIR